MERKNHFDPNSTEARDLIYMFDSLHRALAYKYSSSLSLYTQEHNQRMRTDTTARIETIRIVVKLITGAPFEEFERQVRRNTT